MCGKIAHRAILFAPEAHLDLNERSSYYIISCGYDIIAHRAILFAPEAHLDLIIKD